MLELAEAWRCSASPDRIHSSACLGGLRLWNGDVGNGTPNYNLIRHGAIHGDGM
jgi:hypothetical protein